ncbi:GH36 C-terminal domain-containing protein, partial [Vibrio vulnificus]
IKLHKMLRPLLHSGRTWRVPTDDKAHQIHAVVANDQSQAVVMIAQLAMPTNSLSGHLRVPGLDPQATYRVTVLDKPSNYDDIVNYQPAWTESGCELSGAWCEEVGLTMPILDAESAMLVTFERIH